MTIDAESEDYFDRKERHIDYRWDEKTKKKLKQKATSKIGDFTLK